jgi:hypothetical protein
MRVRHCDWLAPAHNPIYFFLKIMFIITLRFTSGHTELPLPNRFSDYKTVHIYHLPMLTTYLTHLIPLHFPSNFLLLEDINNVSYHCIIYNIIFQHPVALIKILKNVIKITENVILIAFLRILNVIVNDI